MENNNLRESDVVPIEKNWAASTLGGVVAAGALVAEFSHLNDVMRFSAFAAAQKAWGDPMISASVLGASTLFVEGATAVVAADVLATDRAGQLVQKINTKLENLGASKLIKTNIATEAAVVWVGGSAVLTALKHQQDPERTREQNRRYGLTSATGLGLMLTAEGYALSLGIEHPSPVTVGIGALALGGAVGMYKWARHKVGSSTKMNTIDSKSRMELEDYYDVLQQSEKGPQNEGLTVEELNAAISDPRTKMINLVDGQGRARSVPLAVPAEYATWLNPDFFAKKGYKAEALLYFVLPQDILATIPVDKLKTAIKHENGSTLIQKQSVVFDYPETKKPVYEVDMDEDLIVDELITSKNTPAATYHYNEVCSPTESLSNFVADKNVRHLNRSEIELNFDRIWDIYSNQFKALVDDHPINGALAKEALYQSLTADGNRLSAYFDDKNRIMAFGYVVDDISLCPWLNSEYLKAEAHDLPLVYMSGIATAPEATAPLSGKIMLQMIKETFEVHGGGPFMLTYECSNISAQYIPKIVKRTLDASGIVQTTALNELRHFYKVVTF